MSFAGKETKMDELKKYDGNTNLRTYTPTWSDVGKRLLLDTGEAIIPSIPGFIGKILDYPMEAMRNGYEFHAKRTAYGETDVRFGKNLFSAQEPLFQDWGCDENDR